MQSLSECKVMIVDDTESNIDLLVETLNHDYAVSVAMDGASALEFAAESLPDLILLDIMMPGMDGYEVIRRLKADPATRAIPVIFCTVLNEDEDERKGLELGAIDYICKPFSPPIVKARVKNHLELKLAQEALKEQNAVLQENIRLREDVERITRHDLKAPLNALINLPHLIHREGGLSPTQVDLLQMLQDSGYQMLEMINRSLDTYKMEKGAYRLNPVPVDLLEILNQIHVETRGIIQAKRLKLDIKLSEKTAETGDQFLVAGEKMLCYSMLVNLIKNALEASPEGGTVEVRLDDADLRSVTIHNTGLVPQEIRDRFFEKYVTSGKIGGTGLGTYSAALIAKTLGGSISFETSEETGTRLIVRLARAVGAFHARKILVVDGYMSMRRMIVGIMRQMGFVFFLEAADGPSAVEILKAESVDMVITDWNTPGMNGIELLSYMRSSSQLEHIPCIVIGDESRRKDLAEAGRLNLGDYIVRPFSADILKEKVEKLIP